MPERRISRNRAANPVPASLLLSVVAFTSLFGKIFPVVISTCPSLVMGVDIKGPSCKIPVLRPSF